MTRRRILIGSGLVGLAGATATFYGIGQLGSMQDYSATVAGMRSPLTQDPDVREFIRYATLAPSGHNTQPWRFRLRSDGITLLPDLARRTPVVDSDDHHLYVSLGTAAENLALAANARGRPGELHFEPSGDGAVEFTFGGPIDLDSALVEAIPKRQSTRAEFDGRSVSPADLQRLARAATVPGVDLVLLTERRQIDQLSDLVVAGNSAQMADPAFVRELKHWLRFSPRQALATGDGLFSATSGNPTLPVWLGPYIFDWVFSAATENAKYAKQIASSAGIAVFIAEKADPEHWVLAGRACQRFALQATALGLKHAFVNQPVEVPGLRPELAKLVGLAGRRPDLVMRFGYGPTLPYSARRPVEQTILV
ncbi:MAG: nitroreductase family protein [Ancalomicrobiaceae bacterium]|nr:nitroreductase family protein [Ancalomicrobiaceae bacterium]